MRNQVRQAINSNLSGMALSQQAKHRILADIQGGQQTVKRKMTLAMALAIALILITAAALAAVILGGKDVVEQLIAPRAQETQSNRFTKEEVEEILAFAEKHGIVLDEIYVKRIREEGTYFKSELALLFAKDQLGFYPGSWDIEDQHWFAQFSRQIDPDLGADATLPQEGELSQQQIEEKAAQHIQATYGRHLEPLNQAYYRIFRSFYKHRVSPWQVDRVWSVEFSPLTVEGPLFSLELTPKGEVTRVRTDLNILSSGSKEEKARLTLDRFHDLYGNIYGSQDAWSQETWQDLKERLQALDLKPGSIRDAVYLLQQDYLPPEGALTKEAAIEIAAQAVAEHFQVDQARLLDTTRGKLPPESMVYAIYLSAQGQQRWKISFEGDYLAEVDAHSGRVMILDVYSPGNDHLRRYALDVLIAPDKKAYASPVPAEETADLDLDALAASQQLFPTNLEVAPQYFWDQLQAINYNVKTAGGIYTMLYDTYGQDQRFWPILYQAMAHQKEFRPGPGEIMPGLPAPEDLQQEAAVEKAYEAVLGINAGRYEEAFLRNLKPVVAFTFNLYEAGSRSWQIDLVDISAQPQGEDKAYVKLDAITGEVIDARLLDNQADSQADSPSGTALIGIGPGCSHMGEDGRPKVWGDPNAPKEYWDFMAQRYNSREVVEQAFEAWAKEHGDNPSFWPPEPQAVLSLWRMQQHPPEWQDHKPTFNGIPGPGDISLKKAQELAWAAMREAAGDKYSQADYDSVRLMCSFSYNKLGSQGTVWQVEFADSRMAFNSSLGIVLLDGSTGEVLSIDTEQGNG